jgi:crotonobetainyl-CoA:carnitine CoA-transferase CaiB-like acyl-CoA transferase
MSKHRKPFQTSDGYIALLPYTVAQWTRVLKALGREEITTEPWFLSDTERSKRSGDLYAILDGVLGARTSAEWLAFFEDLDVPCGPVHSLDSLLDDPHLKAVGLFEPGYDTAADPAAANVRRAVRQPVIWRGVEPRPDRLAPAVGADTRSLLAELGYGEEERKALKKAGVVRA